jgi:hypothetical protein
LIELRFARSKAPVAHQRPGFCVAEVNKMIKVYGAPIADADVSGIVDFSPRRIEGSRTRVLWKWAIVGSKGSTRCAPFCL